jgi:hypothetical protein
MIAPVTNLSEVVPAELRQRAQWVRWRVETRDGKDTKVPWQAAAEKRAAADNPETWAAFGETLRAYRASTARYQGVGFVFSEEDEFTGIDLDKCIDPDTGEIAAWALSILQQLNSYSERSPSGTGIKVFIRGRLPRDEQGKCRHKRTGLGQDGAGAVEMYDCLRFFTVTGKRLEEYSAAAEARQEVLESIHAELFAKKERKEPERQKPAEVASLDDNELVRKMLAAKNGADVLRLWNGDTSGYDRDDSRADAALCGHIAFYTGDDPTRIDRIFRQSRLYRSKWEREDYRDRTISLALSGMAEFYTPPRPPGENGKTPTPTDADYPSQYSHKYPQEPLGAICANTANHFQQPEWEPPIPFFEVGLTPPPVEVLPVWLATWVEAEAMAAQVPADLPLMLALSAVAVACARKVSVRVQPGWSEPVNIYTVTALPPAARKTTVFADVVKPLEEWEEAEARRMAPEIAEAQSRYKIAEARLRSAEQAAAKAPPEEREALEQEAAELARTLGDMTVPAVPRLLADDTSPERLATLLRDQKGRMAVMSPEGGIFELMAGRYSGKGSGNFEVFLKAHAGDTLRVDRVNRPAEYVRNPALTMGLAVQPDVIRGLADKPSFRGRGLLGRFLYAMPRSLLGSRNVFAPAVPVDVSNAYTLHMSMLLRMPFGTDPAGDEAPHALRLTPEALEALLAFSAWLEPQLAEFGELGGLSDWAGKLVGAVARVSGLLHVADRAGHPAPWEEPIDGAVIERAVRLGKYLIPHARAAYAMMGADPEVEEARYLLATIRRKDATDFKKRDAFEWTKGRFQRVEALEGPLALLERHGFIRERESGDPARRGRPASPTYDVNPCSHNSQNRPAGAPEPISANTANGSVPLGEPAREAVQPQDDPELEVSL